VIASVTLRDVVEEDLPIFFEHQRDPDANRMAAFPARDRESFFAHWHKILVDPSGVIKTIVADGVVAGNVLTFVHEGEREVGYWIGREHYGKGIATRALAALLASFPERPLFAHVARHNPASIRVLEKCGFKVVGTEADFATLDGQPVVGVILKLDDGAVAG
jgi:RimJ/RimL family protein N-acetyltransferase